MTTGFKPFDELHRASFNIFCEISFETAVYNVSDCTYASVRRYSATGVFCQSDESECDQE